MIFIFIFEIFSLGTAIWFYVNEYFMAKDENRGYQNRKIISSIALLAYSFLATTMYTYI